MNPARKQNISQWAGAYQGPGPIRVSSCTSPGIADWVKKVHNLTFPHSANPEKTMQTHAYIFPLQRSPSQNKVWFMGYKWLQASWEMLGFSTIGFLRAFNLLKCVEDLQEGNMVTSGVRMSLATEPSLEAISHNWSAQPCTPQNAEQASLRT